MPANPHTLNKLATKINEAIKKDDPSYDEYYSNATFGRDTTKGRDPANIDKRKLDIFACEDNFDVILKEQFKAHGIKNIYGDPISEARVEILNPGDEGIPAESPLKQTGDHLSSSQLELIDTKITTHHIKNQTFFVMTGFKKGIQMASGKYAQGPVII